jgi:hypothetical protein
MVSRPDIAYAACLLSRYMSNPTKHHWLAAIKVLRYLKGTRTYGLVFGNTIHNNGLKMEAYSDSNWAGDKDDSISTYGYVFKLNGAAVSWRSKKQDKVAHSTAEAEYVAASHTSKEALWLLKLMADTDMKGPITIHMDNKAALSHVNENAFTPNNRHVGVHIMQLLKGRDTVMSPLCLFPLRTWLLISSPSHSLGFCLRSSGPPWAFWTAPSFARIVNRLALKLAPPSSFYLGCLFPGLWTDCFAPSC